MIGHEITHAFDSNGADYDENGDMHNWWTKADSKALTRESKPLKTSGMVWKFTGLR